MPPSAASAAPSVFYERCTAPMHRAVVLLALTPAPDLPALLAKIRVMRAHEMQEDDSLPKPALEVLAEDVGRLGQTEAETLGAEAD